MKEKRKRKINTVSLWEHMVIEMTRYGAGRGMALGALYGIVMLLSIQPNTTYPSIRPFLSSAVFGLPFGAIFGVVGGIILGFSNGLMIALLTRVLFVPPIDSNLYGSSMSAVSLIFTLGSGILIFDSLTFRSSIYRFEFAIVPALIAAIIFAYATQRVTGWYLKSIMQ